MTVVHASRELMVWSCVARLRIEKPILTGKLCTVGHYNDIYDEKHVHGCCTAGHPFPALTLTFHGQPNSWLSSLRVDSRCTSGAVLTDLAL